MSKEIETFFDKFFSSTEYPIDERVLLEKLQQEFNNSQKNSNSETTAEIIAFSFLPNGNPSGDIYYKHYISVETSNGEMRYFLDINDVSEPILAYWAERAEECKYPVLVNRYSDLVVALYEQKMKNRDKDKYHKLIRRVIDTTIEICEKKLLLPINCMTKLKRALSLAMIVKGVEKRLLDLKELMIKMDKCGDEAFEFLVKDKRFKSVVISSDKEKIVSKMEHIVNVGNLSLPRGKKIVSLLAGYYIEQNDNFKLFEVLRKFENCLRQDASFKNNQIARMMGLKDMYKLYSQFIKIKNHNLRDAINKNAYGILRELASLRIEFPDSEKQKIEISQSEVDELLSAIFHGTLQETLDNLTLHFLPNKTKMKRENAGFVSLANKVLASDKGMDASSDDVNTEDNFCSVYYVALELISCESYLCLAMEELKKKFGPSEICDYFMMGILASEDKSLITSLLESFWKKDYLAFNLVIPLIESIIRAIVEICGGKVYEWNRCEGVSYVSLGKLLRDSNPHKGLGDIWDDVSFYFNVVLNHQVGWNIRNNFCHGINKNLFFESYVGNRLFHILLCLGLIKRKIGTIGAPVPNTG